MNVQISIIEVLDLVGKNYSGMSDPFVEVEVLGIKKKTRFQKELTSCVFDETFYFNFEGMTYPTLFSFNLTKVRKISFYSSYYPAFHSFTV